MYYNSKYSKLDPQVLSRWSYLGFTNGLNGDDCVRMANVFEELVMYIIEHTMPNKAEDLIRELSSDEVSVFAFPLARRIYERYHVILQPRCLLQLITKSLPSLRKKYVNRRGLDADACIISDLTMTIGNRFRSRRV